MMPELPRKSLTIGDHIAQGSRFIEVICSNVNCHHARHGFDAKALSSELSFKEAGRRFRCTKCGAKAAWCRPDVAEFYEKLKQQPSQMESGIPVRCDATEFIYLDCSPNGASPCSSSEIVETPSGAVVKSTGVA